MLFRHKSNRNVYKEAFDENSISYLKSLDYEEVKDSQNDKENIENACSDKDAMLNELKAMNIEELLAYASENNINIGNSSSENGIFKKIIEHFKAKGDFDE